MTGRPRRVSDAEVMAATGRAISRLGVRRLTLGEVAAEAGLAPSTLVQRFGSRGGLLLAFAEGGAAGVREIFAAARAEASSPREALELALVRMTEGVRTPAEMAHHLEVLQMDLTDDRFHRHALAHGEALRAEIARTLREGRGSRGGADADRMARAVQTAYNGALLTWAIHREGSVEEAVREALAVLLRPG